MAGTQAAWGIDVGVSSLKALKLRRDGGRVIVEAFEVIEHDKFLTEPDVDRDAATRATLQKFMHKHSLRRDIVYIGVPGSSTFARFVKLPPVETKKIPEIVRFEAIQQIPFPLEQVNWDYHTFQHPDSPDVEVGIFAMKKELVAHVMSNFRAVDMNVQGVQMSPLAVYNAAAYDGMTADKGTVIIDMGAEHTDIVIMDQGRVWLRSISIGGNHFTDALAKSFKQQFIKAEQLKKTAATSKYQKQIYQAMRPIFADLVAEIQRSLGAYNSSHRDSRLERIVGMGNPFKLPNLQKYLQQELKMEVTRLENYKMASVEVEKEAAFSENILSMSTAYGLAIQALGLAAIETNLLPVEIARAMMWKKKQPWFIGASALVALGAMSIGVQWYMAKADFDSAANQKAKADNDADEAKDLNLRTAWNHIDNGYDDAEKKVKAQMSLVESRLVWPGIMADIYAALPQQRGLTGSVIAITGITSDYDYNNALSAIDLSKITAGAGGGIAGGGGGGGGGGAIVTPAGGAGTQPAVGQVGESDHGFVVTITGYARLGDTPTERQLQDIVYQYLTTIMNKAPVNKPAGDQIPRAYYFEGGIYSGRLIKPQPVGGAGVYGGPVAVAAGGGGAANVKPWGNITPGPFWDMFFYEITGIPHPTTGPGADLTGASGASPVMSEPLDLLAPHPNTKAKPMANTYTFTVYFKVHIKNEVK